MNASVWPKGGGKSMENSNLCYLLKGNYNISDVPIEGLTSSNKNNSNSLTNIT